MLSLEYATGRHLDDWLLANLYDRMPYDKLVRVRRKMVELVINDQDWLDRGWWKVYDHIKWRSTQEHQP